MTRYEFIFSDKSYHRISRHLAFWISYCIYFYLQSIPPRKYEEFFIWKTYYIAFLNLCCFAPVFISLVYFFIYYLLPKTIKRKRYLRFIFFFILAYFTGTFINYFFSGIFLQYSSLSENTIRHRLEFGNYNTRWGMIIATVALCIKFTKDWHQQQKENLEILRKKTKSEWQLQKSRIHPEFLLRSLDNIYTAIQKSPDDAPAMILELSDLLSYSIYENDEEMIYDSA